MATNKNKKLPTLTKSDVFYISSFCLSMSLEQIASDLEKDIDVFEETYNNELQKQKNNQKTATQNAMIYSKKPGFTVMTRTASEIGDSTKLNASRPLESHIHFIKNDD